MKFATIETTNKETGTTFTRTDINLTLPVFLGRLLDHYQHVITSKHSDYYPDSKRFVIYWKDWTKKF